MRLTMLRGSCQNGRTCPNINLSDRSTLVVQGYTTSTSLSVGEDVTVAVPWSLLPELPCSQPGFAVIDADTVHITGRRVTDPEALTELALPAGEDAVELPAALAPEGMLIDAH